MENKYNATFELFGLGDIIGSKIFDWKIGEDSVATLNAINEYVYEFIDIGGINGIDISSWIGSDNVPYNIAYSNALLKHDSSSDLFKLTKTNMINTYEELKKNPPKRFIENTSTSKYIKKFTDDIDGRTLQYDPNTGGNAVAPRCMSIGLAYHRKKDLKKLIKYSIEMSKLTHNSPMGYLSGLTTAFFISLAIQEIEIEKWVFQLLELLESSDVVQYITESKGKSDIITSNNIQTDYLEYVRYWKKYVDTRFSNEKPIKTRSTSNLMYRVKYYYDNFVKGSKTTSLGLSGYCSIIMAYDSLLDCNGKWEKLVFYGIMNPSESNTIGAITGGLYGAVYGFGDVPNNLKEFENVNKLKDLGNSFYSKFYKAK